MDATEGGETRVFGKVTSRASFACSTNFGSTLYYLCFRDDLPFDPSYGILFESTLKYPRDIRINSKVSVKNFHVNNYFSGLMARVSPIIYSTDRTIKK